MPRPSASRQLCTRRVGGERAFYGSALTSYTLIMDSDEEMQQIDTEPPSFPSVAKGKGKALNDDLEDPAAGRDDTLPWYMEFLSRSR